MDCPLLRNTECHCPFLHSFSHPTHIYWLKNSIYQALCKHWACEKNMPGHRAWPQWCQHLGQVAIRFNRHVTDSERERAELKTFSQLSMCPKRMATKFLCIEEVGKSSGLIGKKKFVKEVMCAFLFLGLLFGMSSQPPDPTPTPQDDSIFMCLSHEAGGGYVLNSSSSASHGNLYQAHSWSAKSCWADNLIKLKNQTSDIL